MARGEISNEINALARDDRKPVHLGRMIAISAAHSSSVMSM
jgi:hypothetical protein